MPRIVTASQADQLKRLVAQGESARVEFKKSTAEKDRACRTLCAFANGHGGDLIFGVTPAGKVVGQLVTDRTLEELAQEFQGSTSPLNPAIERVINTTRVMPRESGQSLLLESVHATRRWEPEQLKDRGQIEFKGAPKTGGYYTTTGSQP